MFNVKMHEKENYNKFQKKSFFLKGFSKLPENETSY